MTGVVDDSGEGSFPGENSGCNRGVSERRSHLRVSERGSDMGRVGKGGSDLGGIGKGRSELGRVGKRSMSNQGSGKRGSSGRGVSDGDEVTTGAGVKGKVSRAGSDNLRGVDDGERASSGSNRESVAVYAVAQTVSDVVSAEDAAIGGDVAEGTSLVSSGILNSRVSLEGLRVAIASLSKFVLGMVLGLDTSSDRSRNNGRGSDNGGSSNNRGSSNGRVGADKGSVGNV